MLNLKRVSQLESDLCDLRGSICDVLDTMRLALSSIAVSIDDNAAASAAASSADFDTRASARMASQITPGLLWHTLHAQLSDTQMRVEAAARDLLSVAVLVPAAPPVSVQ